ncbi:MAG: hypothetical protein ACLUOI_11095 [Eisenbergiella sp.]
MKKNSKFRGSAKYDVLAHQRVERKEGQLHRKFVKPVCHSFAADGRCISL